MHTKPTGEDAVKYLQRVASSREWATRDGMIFEMHPGEPVLFAHEVELHWMKNGIVGARGVPLWVFKEDTQMEVVNADEKALSDLLTASWQAKGAALAADVAKPEFQAAAVEVLGVEGAAEMNAIVADITKPKAKRVRKSKAVKTDAVAKEESKTAEGFVVADETGSVFHNGNELAVPPVLQVTETVALVRPSIEVLINDTPVDKSIPLVVVAPKKQSKTERAAELAAANPEMSNKDLTALFQKELSMTEAGARTYVYNARRK